MGLDMHVQSFIYTIPRCINTQLAPTNRNSKQVGTDYFKSHISQVTYSSHSFLCFPLGRANPAPEFITLTIISIDNWYVKCLAAIFLAVASTGTTAAMNCTEVDQASNS